MKAGWKSERLGEVCELISGQHIDAKDYNENGRGVAYLTGPSDFGERTPIVTKWTEFPKRMASPGDILITVKGSGVGKINFLDAEVAISRQLMAIRPHGINTDFLYAFLWTHFDHFQSRSTGAAIPGISREDVLSLKCPVPPPSEQKRIMVTLDEVFKGIATAKANAEKNLQNAREVFESHLNCIFSSPGAEWAEKKLVDTCTIARGGSPRPIKAFLTDAADGVNWVKISDATSSLKYIYSTAQRIKPSGVSRSRLVHDGDFILSNSMSFGRPYIMKTTGCIHDGWLVLSEYEHSFSQDFLYLLLGSQFIYRQFDRLAAGSTVRNLNIDLASGVIVPVPPLKEQERLAEALGSFDENVQQLSKIYQQKMETLDELKQSLLHRAFNGDL